MKGGWGGGAVDERYVMLGGGGRPALRSVMYKRVGGCQVFWKKVLRNT